MDCSVATGCLREPISGGKFQLYSDSEPLSPRAPSLASPFTLSAKLLCLDLKMEEKSGYHHAKMTEKGGNLRIMIAESTLNR